MFTELTDAVFDESVSSQDSGILLCFKKLCPHCKNMEKVLEKFVNKNAGVPIFLVDSEDNPRVMKRLNTDRIPTVAVIKEGKIVAQRSGLMNPKEMTAFFNEA